MTHLFRATALLALTLFLSPTLAQQDTDRDGLPDEIEEQLATDPGFADALETVGEFRRAEGRWCAERSERET